MQSQSPYSVFLLCYRVNFPVPGELSFAMVHNPPKGDKPEGWGFPGGSVRPYETRLTAVIREAREEANVNPGEEDMNELREMVRMRVNRLSEPEHYNCLYGLLEWKPEMGELTHENDPSKFPVLDAQWVATAALKRAYNNFLNGEAPEEIMDVREKELWPDDSSHVATNGNGNGNIVLPGEVEFEYVVRRFYASHLKKLFELPVLSEFEEYQRRKLERRRHVHAVS